MENIGIVNSWSLMAFARSHGNPKLTAPKTNINSQTKEEFTSRSLAFVDPTKVDEQGKPAITYVGFSQKLGELSAAEIVARANELQVVERANGRYSLCTVGTDAWQEVDLGL